jgi:hypothetical protein
MSSTSQVLRPSTATSITIIPSIPDTRKRTYEVSLISSPPNNKQIRASLRVQPLASEVLRDVQYLGGSPATLPSDKELHYASATKYEYVGDSLENLHWTEGTPIKIWINKDLPKLGGMRVAYSALIGGDPKKYMAKRYQDQDDEADAPSAHQQDIQMLRAAKFLVDVWQQDVRDHIVANTPANTEVRKQMLSVKFVDGFLVRVEEDGRKAFYMVEEYIAGTFRKYNSNVNFDFPRPGEAHLLSFFVMNSLTHHSYIKSGGKILLCDLQGMIKLIYYQYLMLYVNNFTHFGSDIGAKEWLTDPQIHTLEPKKYRGFGRGNWGPDGITMFEVQHKCNLVCRLMKLPKLRHAEPEQVESSSIFRFVHVNK